MLYESDVKKMSKRWTTDQISDQTDRVIIVTGASSGIGYETAWSLAEKGATVIMAVRNSRKGMLAVQKILSGVPQAKVTMILVDLADLASVQRFVSEFKEQYPRLDVLINNAGIMIPPLQLTQDGFESQFGANHLGHFALTGLLLDRLKVTPHSRVITISSLAAHHAQIDFNNLDGRKGYKPIEFYGQSKLANMLFARELQRQLTANQLETISLTCHPGFSQSNLFSRGSGKTANPFLRFLQNRVSQPANMGALPTLYAATEASLTGGEYIGPDGKKKRKGYPKQDRIIDELDNQQVSETLWQISEKLTGVTYHF